VVRWSARETGGGQGPPQRSVAAAHRLPAHWLFDHRKLIAYGVMDNCARTPTIALVSPESTPSALCSNISR
jgi:hypothetical protein